MPDWLNVILRSVLFLVVLFLITKLLGKKQIAQLSMFEYVTGITIGNIGAEVVTGVEEKVSLGLIALCTTAAIPFLSSILTMKNKALRDVLDGKGTIIIKDGKILEENLKKEKVTLDELMEMLRKESVFNMADVEYAVLEANGILNVLLKKECRPITPKDLNMKVAQEKEPQVVIMDGQILYESLAQAGKSAGWLKTELAKMDATVENVFFAQVDSFGILTIDLYDDQIQQPVSQEIPVLYATMKKCQADLELFALSTESEEAKQIYVQNSKKLQKAIDQIAHIMQKQ